MHIKIFDQVSYISFNGSIIIMNVAKQVII